MSFLESSLEAAPWTYTPVFFSALNQPEGFDLQLLIILCVKLSPFKSVVQISTSRPSLPPVKLLYHKPLFEIWVFSFLCFFTCLHQ